MQNEKQSFPILITLSGMLIEDKFVHPRNAYSPISSKESGNEISVSDEQSKKAPSSIEMTPSGITIEVREEQLAKSSLSICVKLFDKFTDFNSAHSINALHPIFFTVLGIEIECNLFALLKARCLIDVTVYGVFL